MLVIKHSECTLLRGQMIGIMVQTDNADWNIMDYKSYEGFPQVEG